MRMYSRTRLRHTWKTLLNAGYAKHLLTSAVQQQIIKIQQELGFRYLRFHGMLDQELHIYQGMETRQSEVLLHLLRYGN